MGGGGSIVSGLYIYIYIYICVYVCVCMYMHVFVFCFFFANMIYSEAIFSSVFYQL